MDACFQSRHPNIYLKIPVYFFNFFFQDETFITPNFLPILTVFLRSQLGNDMKKLKTMKGFGVALEVMKGYSWSVFP